MAGDYATDVNCSFKQLSLSYLLCINGSKHVETFYKVVPLQKPC